MTDCRQILTCGFHHSFQDDHNLKLLLLQLGAGHLPEGAFLIDLVRDDERGHQEQPVISGVKSHVDVRLVQGNKLSFFGLFGLNQFGSNGSLDNVGIAEVPDPEHEAELPSWK